MKKANKLGIAALVVAVIIGGITLACLFIYSIIHLPADEWVFTDHRIEVINGC